VRQTVFLNGVLQRGGDVLLSHHLVELLRAPFPRQNLVLLSHEV